MQSIDVAEGPEAKKHPATSVLYRPPRPERYRPPLGLIGCGGIARHHLQAYRNGGFEVVALADINLAAAEKMRDQFFPDAKVFDNHHDLLREEAIEVVDVATHTDVRPPIIDDVLATRRHVLSQKPFVTDLDVGERLVERADRFGVRLAVNQNGRWAPHFSFIRAAIAQGLLGETFAARMTCDWDHTWVAGTPFEKIRHLILYDYAIHWFDIVRCFLPGNEATRVYATATRAVGQNLMPSLLGQVLIEFDRAQATMTFDAIVRYGPEERTYVAGTAGSAKSVGTGNQDQTVTVTTAEGPHVPTLDGKWFPDGFQGTMAELLLSIEQKRPSLIDAADNLRSLALCFAAIASAETQQPKTPGEVRQLPE